MIIYLNLQPETLASVPNGEADELLSEIARASRRGNHIFVLSRVLAKWASGVANISSANRAEFLRLYQHAGQRFDLIAKAVRYIEITIGNGITLNEAENKWIVGHRYALSGELFSEAQLILEDAGSDGDIFRLIFDRTTLTQGEYTTKFRICHGGGNQTFKRLKEKIDEHYVCICICDNDMHAPKGARSETFIKASTEALKREFVGKFFSTPCREIENLIPIQILRKLYPASDSYRLDQLEKTITMQGEVDSGDCLWNYFDVKEGVNVTKLIDKCREDEAQTWLKSKYLVDGVSRLEDVDYPGFGDRVISTFLNSHLALKEYHTFMRSKHWKIHFEPFFEHVSWYLAGTKERRL